MKKFLVLAVIFVMTFSFTACGEKSKGNKDSSMEYSSNNQNSSGLGSDIKSDISSGMSDVESFTESTIDGLTGDSSTNNSTNSSKNNSMDSSDSGYSENQIKEKVLKHAGLTENDVKHFNIDSEYDDGRKVYDVDFISGNMEYSYKLDAKTGEILEHEKENND